MSPSAQEATEQSADKVKFPTVEEIQKELASRIIFTVGELKKFAVPVDPRHLTPVVSYRGKEADIIVSKHSDVLTGQRRVKDYLESGHFQKEYETVQSVMNAPEGVLLDIPMQFPQSIILENYTRRVVDVLKNSGFDELGDAIDSRMPQLIAEQKKLRGGSSGSHGMAVVGGRNSGTGKGSDRANF